MGTSKKYKSHWCSRCGLQVDSMTRLEQDSHEIECLKQEKLF